MFWSRIVFAMRLIFSPGDLIFPIFFLDEVLILYYVIKKLSKRKPIRKGGIGE